MAVEVQLNRYLYTQPVHRAIHHGPPVAETEPQHQQMSTSNIRHNYLHDIESMWWIAIWTYLRIVPTDATADHIKKIEALFLDIFPNSASGSNSRSNFLLDPVLTMENTLQYPYFWAMIQPILDTHSALIEHYLEYETRMEEYLQHKKFSKIYGSFATYFRAAMDNAPSSVTFLHAAHKSVKPVGTFEEHGITALPAAASEAPMRQLKKRRIAAVPTTAGEALTGQPKKRRIAAAPAPAPALRQSRRVRKLPALEGS